MARMGLPFMLEDRSGSLSGSEFVDLHDRMYLSLRCRRRDANGASQYEIYNMRSKQYNFPVATLEYGVGGALGSVTLIGPGGMPRTHTMGTFLAEVGGSRHRKFTASDGKEYSWSWRTNMRENLEWSCVGANGQTVAWYALKVPGEHYANSSGCMLGVEEPYPHLAVELLATLLVMRHIAAHDM
ncbi:hypothetical protein BJV78DRAFT_657752 [Lactifluus subvellereus]|nr:hypothetical protein BJV78DRAFT_657752 [Lactifluus subvellereus]